MDSTKPGVELLADLAERISANLTGIIPEVRAIEIGEAIALQMAEYWGGQLIYFSKGKFVLLSRRDRTIYAEFDGTNIKDLCRRYNISEAHLYRIIKAMRRTDLAERHDDLFDSQSPS